MLSSRVFLSAVLSPRKKHLYDVDVTKCLADGHADAAGPEGGPVREGWTKNHMWIIIVLDGSRQQQQQADGCVHWGFMQACT